MKRVLKQNPQIVITIEFGEVPSKIAAWKYVNHPQSIRKRNRLNEQQLKIFNDVVESGISTIRSHNFPIVSSKQKGNQYSYYIQFQPINSSGEKLTPVDIVFRIAHHPNAGADNSNLSARVRIVSLLLNRKKFDNSIQLIEAMDVICEELSKGNFDILDQF